jgi:hypothetical protein
VQCTGGKGEGEGEVMVAAKAHWGQSLGMWLHLLSVYLITLGALKVTE